MMRPPIGFALKSAIVGLVTIAARPAIGVAGANSCDPTPATKPSTNPDQDKLPQLRPFVDELPLPKRARPVAVTSDEHGHRVEHYRIVMKRSQVRLHSQIPADRPTPIFGYDGTFPGPTFDVHHRTTVVVEWVNRIEPVGDPNDPKAPHILRGVVVPPTVAVPFPQDWPGSGPTATFETAKPAPIWTVVHLHGGTTPPGSDGWPDDAFPTGQGAVYTYPGEPRATALWYHDHADMITRLNVAAGLAGFYLVRDEVEERLGLPRLRYGEEGVPLPEQLELPLLIQDRNLEVGPDNRFTGAMLHKVAQDGAEFYGPYTLVNGRIWPYVRVEPRQVRLRLLNGSNGRFYRLRLRDDQGHLSTEQFRQIGTDSGLLDGPVAIPARGLTLAPAERADVILDLSSFAGRSVALVNDYPMPMIPVGQNPENEPDAPIHPEVLQFRVAERCRTPDTLKLPASFVPLFPEGKSPRPDRSQPAAKRKIYLIEDPPGTLTINGRLFHDRVEEVVHLGDAEVWEIYNTTGDFHPFHIHLVDFEILDRTPFGDGFEADKWVPQFRLWQAADPSVRLADPPEIALRTDTHCPVDDNERGLKDTVRVGPRAVTRILIRFGPHAGRYVYHCHILEHEDMEMMRPYLILPEGLELMGTNFGTGSQPAAVPGNSPASARRHAAPRGAAAGHGMAMPGGKRTVRRRIP